MKIIFKYIFLLVAVFIMGVAEMDARRSTNLQRQRRNAQQQARITEQRLQANREAMKKNLNELNLLDAEIGNLDRRIKRLNATSDSLRALISPLSDSIATMSARLDTMRVSYARVLRKTYRNDSDIDELSFIFSASNFSQAWRRSEALKQFSHWRKRKSDEILKTREVLEEKKLRLDSMSTRNARIVANVKSERRTLGKKKSEVDKLVKQLESSSAELQKEIERRNAEMASLDRKIEEAMAEEERERQEEARRREQADREKQAVAAQPEKEQAQSDVKKQDKPKASKTDDTPPIDAGQLTVAFEKSKGKLQSPVGGKLLVVKKFGRQKHPRLPKVYTENAGIDIETDRGASVKAVFAGEVSQIFKIGGYNNVVVIRHGDYVTVYANVVDLKVAKGTRVSAGDTLGHVYVDTSDNNRSVLHFELRKGKDKQDPEIWLKR